MLNRFLSCFLALLLATPTPSHAEPLSRVAFFKILSEKLALGKGFEITLGEERDSRDAGTSASAVETRKDPLEVLRKFRMLTRTESEVKVTINGLLSGNLDNVTIGSFKSYASVGGKNGERFPIHIEITFETPDNRRMAVTRSGWTKGEDVSQFITDEMKGEMAEELMEAVRPYHQWLKGEREELFKRAFATFVAEFIDSLLTGMTPALTAMIEYYPEAINKLRERALVQFDVFVPHALPDTGEFAEERKADEEKVDLMEMSRKERSTSEARVSKPERVGLRIRKEATKKSKKRVKEKIAERKEKRAKDDRVDSMKPDSDDVEDSASKISEKEISEIELPTTASEENDFIEEEIAEQVRPLPSKKRIWKTARVGDDDDRGEADGEKVKVVIRYSHDGVKNSKDIKEVQRKNDFQKATVYTRHSTYDLQYVSDTKIGRVGRLGHAWGISRLENGKYRVTFAAMLYVGSEKVMTVLKGQDMRSLSKKKAKRMVSYWKRVFYPAVLRRFRRLRDEKVKQAKTMTPEEAILPYLLVMMSDHKLVRAILKEDMETNFDATLVIDAAQNVFWEERISAQLEESRRKSIEAEAFLQRMRETTEGIRLGRTTVSEKKSPEPVGRLKAKSRVKPKKKDRGSGLSGKHDKKIRSVLTAYESLRRERSQVKTSSRGFKEMSGRMDDLRSQLWDLGYYDLDHGSQRALLDSVRQRL